MSLLDLTKKVLGHKEQKLLKRDLKAQQKAKLQDQINNYAKALEVFFTANAWEVLKLETGIGKQALNVRFVIRRNLTDDEEAAVDLSFGYLQDMCGRSCVRHRKVGIDDGLIPAWTVEGGIYPEHMATFRRFWHGLSLHDDPQWDAGELCPPSSPVADPEKNPLPKYPRGK